MLNNRIPVEVVRHGAAVLSTLFVCFLCAYVVLKTKERRGPLDVRKGTGPVFFAWAFTVFCSTLLIAATFVGLRLQSRSPLQEVFGDGPGVEVSRRSLGIGLLEVSVIVLPLMTLIVWIGMLRESRRRNAEPGRHSSTVLWGLLTSGAGLGIFLLVYADRLLG